MPTNPFPAEFDAFVAMADAFVASIVPETDDETDDLDDYIADKQREHEDWYRGDR